MQSFGIGAFTLAPASFGEALVSFPLVEFDQTKQMFAVDGSISAELESFSLFSALKAFIASFVLTFSSEIHDGSDAISTYCFRLPHVEAKILQPTAYRAALQNVCIDVGRSLFSVEKITASGAYGACCSACGIMVTPSLCVSFKEIDKLHLPGVVSLVEPIRGALVEYKENTAFIRFPSANLLVETPTHSPGSPKPTTQSLETMYPIRSLKVVVEENFNIAKSFSASK